MIALNQRMGLALTTALACACIAPVRAADLTVHTTEGVAQGIATATTAEFLGIPYAAPPVGPLRWKPPQPTSWPGVLDASHLASPCPQTPGAFAIPSTDEDCLFLNVYVPLAATSKLPVMLWIHGGAFSAGTGAGYDGSALAADGVIVITINYRLGELGFLTAPALDAESPGHASGDYGLMDQQAALRWAKANAAAFGGDPDSITVFGESAGGQSVFDQLAAPAAAGLFRRAIIESGAYAPYLPTHATAVTKGAAFSAATGCTSTTDASCLRALPVSAILAEQAAESGPGGSIAQVTQFEPDVGTTTLPVQPIAAIALGAFNRVPVLQGTNHDEGRLFPFLQFDSTGVPLAASNYPATVATVTGNTVAPLATALYPLSAYASPDLAYAAVFTDNKFSCSGLGFNDVLSRYVPAYAYEFADEDAARLLLPNDPFMPVGAAHATELSFLWPSQAASSGVTMTAAEQQLATEMRAAWTNFAKAGNPNGPGVTSWPAFDAAERIQELVPATPYVNTSFRRFHKCDVWQPLLALNDLNGKP